MAAGIGRNRALNIGVGKNKKSQFPTIGGAGETFPPNHPGFFNFCGGGFWAGIPGCMGGIGRNWALNIGVGKSWKSQMGGGGEMYVGYYSYCINYNILLF